MRAGVRHCASSLTVLVLHRFPCIASLHVHLLAVNDKVKASWYTLPESTLQLPHCKLAAVLFDENGVHPLDFIPKVMRPKDLNVF